MIKRYYNTVDYYHSVGVLVGGDIIQYDVIVKFSTVPFSTCRANSKITMMLGAGESFNCESGTWQPIVSEKSHIQLLFSTTDRLNMFPPRSLASRQIIRDTRAFYVGFDSKECQTNSKCYQ